MKILITGFQPFGGQRVNPAWEAVRKLPDVLGDKVLWKLEIPVTFGGAFDAVEAKAAEVDPDVIDLSSAVEKVSKDGAFCGKDPEKIKTIITIVHGQ